MDTGGFYGGTISSMVSLTGSSLVPPHIATPYDPYMSMGGHAQAAHAVGIGVNQKLDKILLLFTEQKSKTADLKEVAHLAAEVASLNN